MPNKEYKINETFQLGFVRLKAEKPPKGVISCCHCFIGGITSDCRVFKQVIGECIGEKRKDKTDVIFVKVDES